MRLLKVRIQIDQKGNSADVENGIQLDESNPMISMHQLGQCVSHCLKGVSATMAGTLSDFVEGLIDDAESIHGEKYKDLVQPFENAETKD